MRRFTLNFLLLLLLLLLVAALSPASGQDGPPPEATPEPTAEAVVELSPEAPPYPIVFERSIHCSVSPDGSAVAVPNDGVYNLRDGSLRFALPQIDSATEAPAANYSPLDDGLWVSGYGQIDPETGALIIPMGDETTAGNARWRVVGSEIYDAATGERVARFELAGQAGPVGDIWLPANSDLIVVPAGRLEDHFTIIHAPTGETLAEFERAGFSISPDGTKYAIAGDGLYDVATRARLTELPAGQYRPHFSPYQPEWLAVDGADGVIIYDTRDGTLAAHLPPPPGANRWESVWGEDAIFITGGLFDEADRGGSFVMVPGQLYAIPDGELLRDASIGVPFHYIGGARRAWQRYDGIFDPFTDEMLVEGGRFQRRVGDRAVVEGRGEFDIDTWELRYEYPPRLAIHVVLTDDDYRFAVVQGRGLYDAQTGEVLLRERHGLLSLTPDGRYLVVSHYLDGCIVYDLSVSGE